MKGKACDSDLGEVISYFKILILLFSDDTVMFVDSEDESQRALDNCNIMKLTVNVSETKIVIFTNEKKLTIYVLCSNHSLWK